MGAEQEFLRLPERPLCEEWGTQATGRRALTFASDLGHS